jgi:hypothetical protein
MPNSFEERLKLFLAGVRSGETWAIFDVDRVFLSRTSWHWACLKRDLLIPEHRATEYRSLHRATYVTKTLSSQEFRKASLALLPATVSPEMAKAHANHISVLGENEPIGPQVLYSAGRIIANEIPPYKGAVRYLRYLSRLYGSGLRVLFLSAGAEPFIAGVVQSALAKCGLTEVRYEVLGSGIGYSSDGCREAWHCFGEHKRQVAQLMLAKGAMIVFAADDDPANHALLNQVKLHGGTVFAPRREDGQKGWYKFLLGELDRKRLMTMLKTGHSGVALPQNEWCKGMREVHEMFDAVSDPIGICSLPTQAFKNALRELTDRFSLNDRFCGYLEEMITRTPRRTYLRGKLFYYGLPPYLSLSSESVLERFAFLFSISTEAFELLSKLDLPASWSKLSKAARLILLMVVDHYKHALFSALNSVSRQAVHYKNESAEALRGDLRAWCESATDFYYQLLLGQPTPQTLHRPKELEEAVVRIVLKEPFPHQAMRELDDNFQIARSVLHVAAAMHTSGVRYAYVATPLFGSVELGYALRSVLSQLYSHAKPPEVVPFPLSIHRDKEAIISLQASEPESWLDYFLPKPFETPLRAGSLKEKNVLLFDNNVTTFRTLTLIASQLAQRTGAVVHTAAAAVNYENLVSWLRSEPCEELASGWESSLTYMPASEYVTAFNTWGTSQKSARLEGFFKRIQPLNHHKLLPGIDGDLGTLGIVKACRVHNLIDLTTVLRCGFNAIGLHAVYDDQKKYLQATRTRAPVIANGETISTLPIPVYERAGIAAMLSATPDWVKKVVIVERRHEIETLREILTAYSLDPKDVILQFQHRVDRNYLIRVRNELGSSIMAAIGGNQTDFKDYFRALEDVLDETRDCILVDLSKHQPDILAGHGTFTEGASLFRLRSISRILKESRVRIVLADDTAPEVMKRHLDILKQAGVKLHGIDMQNCLEVETNEIGFAALEYQQGKYHALVRKCPVRCGKWKSVLGQWQRENRFSDIRSTSDLVTNEPLKNYPSAYSASPALLNKYCITRGTQRTRRKNRTEEY